jgi:thymidylate synthase (FAD)
VISSKEASSLSLIDPQQLFQEMLEQVHQFRPGEESSGFPALHTPPHYSPAGVPYLTAPGVVVLAKPTVNMAGLAGFLEGFDPALQFPQYLDDPTPLPDGAQLCKVAGQLCYMSFAPRRSTNAQAKKYFDNIKLSKHGSVCEHANFSLLLYGISRSLTHELVRHRSGFGYSQLSQRFVSGKMLRFVERPEYQVDEELHAQFLQRIERAASEYNALTERLLGMQKAGSTILSAEARTDLRKKVQQAARSVLPNETEAPIVVTGNARAWRHVIEERASAHAETEIRALAIRVLLCLRQADPVLFDDYTIENLADGTYVAETEFKKI